MSAPEATCSRHTEFAGRSSALHLRLVEPRRQSSSHGQKPGSPVGPQQGGAAMISRILVAAALVALAAAMPEAATPFGSDDAGFIPPDAPDSATTTPIKHLVVLFQENVPFDRYFGVYPRALNPGG